MAEYRTELLSALLVRVQAEGLPVSFDGMEEADLWDALDRRAEEDFETRWLAVHRHLEGGKDQLQHPELIQSICREVFLSVFRALPSDELAGEISDDFGLICQALDIGYQDPWLNGLLACYLKGSLPQGALQTSEEDLPAQLQRFLER